MSGLFAVTATLRTKTDRHYVKVVTHGTEEAARDMWIDNRARESRLWHVAPPGYLGPCMVIAASDTPMGTMLRAKIFETTEAARAFVASCPSLPKYGPGYRDPGPIMAEPQEIAEWRRLIKKPE